MIGDPSEAMPLRIQLKFDRNKAHHLSSLQTYGNETRCHLPHHAFQQLSKLTDHLILNMWISMEDQFTQGKPETDWGHDRVLLLGLLPLTGTAIRLRMKLAAIYHIMMTLSPNLMVERPCAMLFACWHTDPKLGFVLKIIHASPEFVTTMNEKVEGVTHHFGRRTLLETDRHQCFRLLLEETRRKNGGKFSLDLEQRTSGPRLPFQSCVENCIWKFSLAESFSRVDE